MARARPLSGDVKRRCEAKTRPARSAAQPEVGSRLSVKTEPMSTRPRDRLSKVGPWLRHTVLRVDAVPTKKITEPLDLITQGWEGCPLLQASGLVAEQMLFPVAQH